MPSLEYDWFESGLGFLRGKKWKYAVPEYDSSEKLKLVFMCMYTGIL